MKNRLRELGALVAFVAGLAAQVATVGRIPPAVAAGRPAEDVIRTAIEARMGPGVEVRVGPLDARLTAGSFRQARPDPAARLGSPVRFSMITDAGQQMAASIELTVIADFASAARPIARGRTLSEGDVTARRDEVRGVPIRALPTAAAIAGGKALRPIAEGAVVLQEFVAVRRAVEQGDVVTAIAISGEVEVAARMVASDGGRRGDVVRVMNPDTRRVLRARVIGPGYVEVLNVR